MKTKQKKSKQKKSKDDYDSPWKEIIRQYFEYFLAFFFPKAHQEIDWGKGYAFLDKELRKIAIDAEVGQRYVDILVQVCLKKGGDLWVLTHFEVQGQREEVFPERMYTYHYRIFDKHHVSVANFAILADESKNWKPTKYTESLLNTKLTFQFSVVKLLDYKKRLKWLEKNDNPFATVVLAHLKTKETAKKYPERIKAKLAITKGLYTKGYSKQDILNLYKFIDWVMRLPPTQEKIFYKKLDQFEEEKKMKYITSIERIGIEKGEKKGKQEGKQESLLAFLRGRFGRVPKNIKEKIEGISSSQKLTSLIKQAGKVESLAELKLS